MSYVSVDIDIDDVIVGMSSRDRRYLLTELQKDGYISEGLEITKSGHVVRKGESTDNNDSHTEFNDSVSKLYGNGWRLSLEEEQFIINIAKRF
jgi:hypothetical protein